MWREGPYEIGFGFMEKLLMDRECLGGKRIFDVVGERNGRGRRWGFRNRFAAIIENVDDLMGVSVK